ncbi:unnamed protein product [Penicillium salamii]|uniref:ABC transporter n=1 Tax=Penicillium salamii TaxID=1612424 RepID=A0A9W4JID3_9EURO|nr:unnamed protein product [Penicillium salamii]
MGTQMVTSTETMAPDDQATTETTSDIEVKNIPLQDNERVPTSKDYLRIFTYAELWDVLTLAAGALAAVGSGATQPLMFLLFGECLLFVFALFIARFGLASIQKFAFRMISIRLSAAIRLHYITHLFSQSVHVLDSLPPGHAVGTITSSSNTLQGGISEKLAIFIEYTTLIIGSFIVAFVQSWELSLVTLAGFFAIMLLAGSLFPFTVKGQTRQIDMEKKAASIASESFASIKMIMACGAQQQTSDKYISFIEQAKRQAQVTNVFTSLQFALTFFGVFGTIALAFWYGALIYTKDRLDNVGVIAVVLLCMATIFFSVDRVSTPLQAMGKASIAACEFFSVIDAPLPKKGTLKAPEISATKDIVFDKVTFAYPSRPDIKILDELNLCIEAGKMTAIVGSSGSGKSTIVGLIEGWYIVQQPHSISIPKAKDTEEDQTTSQVDTPDYSEACETKNHPVREPVKLEGTISTSGHLLEDIDVKWWRSRIGLVQQEPFLFNDTVFENVARGLIGTPWDSTSKEEKRALVVEACQEAFADEFIIKLPLGYDTCIGDGGARLSGGQRQRLAIARSIVKKPHVLILDEATSAIDVHSEQIVQAALDKAARNRTTIVIAHRLSTIKNADRIVVLQKGKVVESGSHQNLMSMNGGVYFGLVNAQTLSLGESTKIPESSPKTESIETFSRELTIESEKTHEIPLKPGEKQVSNRKIFGSFLRLFIESKSHWNIMILGIAVSAVAGVAQPMHAWMYARSISLFKWQDDHPKLMSEVEFMGIMWTVFAASAGTAYFVTFLCFGYVGAFIRAKYQAQYFESLIHQPAAYFDEDGHSHGTLVARTRDDPQKLEEMMGMNLAQVFIAVFNIIVGIIISLAYTWKLALVSLCAVAPICVLSGYIRFRYEVQFEDMNDAVFEESSQFASEAIGAFRTVTSLTLEDSITDRFRSLCQGHVVSAYKKARWVSVILGFSESTNLGCQALIFYYGGHLLTQGEIDNMGFFLCLMAIMNAAEGFGKSLSFGPNAAQAALASSRVHDTRCSSLQDARGKDHITLQEGGIEIELRDIRLRYPTRNTPALDGLNITIEKGQFAALVGASGCGKTSVISLLERLYDPEEGQILLNGEDVANVNVYEYRKHLALVAQESTLFQGPIRDNILLGVDPSTVTEDQLQNVSREASIHDFIVSLPEGYSTNIGSRGITLSGGQKQRIAIARALIRRPQILLLDEATSSLDSESEKQVQTALERAAQGRTMIAVAHRLATVQNADVIFVLGEAGKVLERGSHLELVEKRGVYYQMVGSNSIRIQAIVLTI